MIDPYNGYIFIVKIRNLSEVKNLELDSDASKRIYHFIKKDNEWVLTLLKRDESKIPSKFPRNNIIRHEFDLQPQIIRPSAIKFEPPKTKVAIYWKEVDDIFDTIICSKPNAKSIEDYCILKLDEHLDQIMFIYMDKYLRQNEDKFFK